MKAILPLTHTVFKAGDVVPFYFKVPKKNGQVWVFKGAEPLALLGPCISFFFIIRAQLLYNDVLVSALQ